MVGDDQYIHRNIIIIYNYGPFSPFLEWLTELSSRMEPNTPFSLAQEFCDTLKESEGN